MMIIEKDEEKEGKEKKCELSNNRPPPYRSDNLYLQPCLSSGHSCKVRYSCFFEFFLEGPEKCRQPSTHGSLMPHGSVRTIYREEAKPKPKASSPVAQ